MSTSVGLAGNLDAALMDHDRLLLEVVSPDSDGGSTITPLEGHRMRRHFYDRVAPVALKASDGLSVIRSIASSDEGVCAERTSARITHIWERRGGGPKRVLKLVKGESR